MQFYNCNNQLHRIVTFCLLPFLSVIFKVSIFLHFLAQWLDHPSSEKKNPSSERKAVRSNPIWSSG